MPRVSLYVTEADKAVLDALPLGMTGAAILREALGRWRRGGEDCTHPAAEMLCPDCGLRAPIGDAHPMRISDPEDTPEPAPA
jgi:hypothetical protein